MVGEVGGGSPGQVTPRSGSEPGDLKVTKPGWLLLMRPLIHDWYSDTLAYTPGKFGRAQPLPKLTTPPWTQRVPCLLTSGPPESPFQERNQG